MSMKQRVGLPPQMSSPCRCGILELLPESPHPRRPNAWFIIARKIVLSFGIDSFTVEPPDGRIHESLAPRDLRALPRCGNYGIGQREYK